MLKDRGYRSVICKRAGCGNKSAIEPDVETNQRYIKEPEVGTNTNLVQYHYYAGVELRVPASECVGVHVFLCALGRTSARRCRPVDLMGVYVCVRAQKRESTYT